MSPIIFCNTEGIQYIFVGRGEGGRGDCKGKTVRGSRRGSYSYSWTNKGRIPGRGGLGGALKEAPWEGYLGLRVPGNCSLYGFLSGAKVTVACPQPLLVLSLLAIYGLGVHFLGKKYRYNLLL